MLLVSIYIINHREVLRKGTIQFVMEKQGFNYCFCYNQYSKVFIGNDSIEVINYYVKPKNISLS